MESWASRSGDVPVLHVLFDHGELVAHGDL
jgi:hypothetical protein